MNWKVFIIASISLVCLAFPENGITCGPTEDPHDYFTTFFSNSLGTTKVYRPFYYSSLLKFYDDEEQDSVTYEHDKVIEEWKQYTRVTSTDDAVNLIYKSSETEIKRLLSAVQNGEQVPSDLKKNQMALRLGNQGKLDALKYLQFAKKTEAFSAAPDWNETRKRDSLALNKYIDEAGTAVSKTSDAFVKDKYAFQHCKLAFYNNRFSDCIRWYDDYFTDANTSAVNQLALSYKAGSLFKLGKKKEAAYLFSKAFPLSDQNKRRNYEGFLWSTDFCDPALEKDYLSLCKNKQERANMRGMFALFGVSYKLPEMQDVYNVDPSSPLLPLIATREVNKLEEQYFTPLLAKEKGGKQLYVTWDDEDTSKKIDQKGQLVKTTAFFEKLFADQNVSKRSIYGAGAAYLYFINKDYANAKRLVGASKGFAKDEKTNDQLQLINLLILANEKKVLDAQRETEILPAIKWLCEKANKEREYRLFARNFFSEILAQKYEQQGDAYKAALAYGMADLPFVKPADDYYYYSYPQAIQYVQSEMNSVQLLKLYDLESKPGPTEAEKFFIDHSSFKRDDVIDVLGTAFLRDRNYDKAIEWFKKANKVDTLKKSVYNYNTDKERNVNIDPFYDYLNDWQRYDKSIPVAYTKLTLAMKLSELEKKIPATTNAEEKSKIYYQLASALYNMSYYGNNWNALAYDRSGSDWNTGHYKLQWQKEYYGVYKSGEYYQKAYDLTKNKEFKAACLFMVAKCVQRQIPKPDYNYDNYDQYEKDEAVFEKKFKNNALFPKFKSEFGSTKYYQYVFNRCSYLRDFVRSSRPNTHK